ncbi:cytoplasmic protein [Labrenzia sp. 011]|nr:cytoplasmic protein [Labrenzia sp. 011]
MTVCAGFALPAAAEENHVYFSFAGKQRVPDCSAASVRSAVAGSVARAKKDYYEGRTILGIDEIRETGYQVDGLSPVARRYCRGKASLSDGSYQSVEYLVEEHGGFLGIGWNVEACMAPLDKWHVYGDHCSTTRPH